MMIHPKMRFTYVGIDSHKQTHTAVLLDCFFDRCGEITFKNLPSAYEAFLREAESLKVEGTELLFGLEDATSFGRTLAVFLEGKGKQVRHVNSYLVARERKNLNITQKTDTIDAECAARVLLSRSGELPVPGLEDRYWILRTLVVRRDHVVSSNTRSKMLLHSLLTQHYPNYRQFFGALDGKTSLAFYKTYPSPSCLEGVSLEELTTLIAERSSDYYGEEKAIEIRSSLEDTTASFQEIRDEMVRSTICQIEFNLKEMERLELIMATYLENFRCTLTTMAGIDVVSACQILSCIGDIKRFSTPAKLARYAGVAPITYSSGQKDLQFANSRGNRELNSLFYNLAVRVSTPHGPNKKLINGFFYDYYQRKRSEGKTKRQALKCVQRRLVNIIWCMLTHAEEYVNPPLLDEPPKKGR